MTQIVIKKNNYYIYMFPLGTYVSPVKRDLKKQSNIKLISRFEKELKQIKPNKTKHKKRKKINKTLKL